MNRLPLPPISFDPAARNWAGAVSDAIAHLPELSIISTTDGPNTSGTSGSLGALAVDIGSSATRLWQKHSGSTSTSGWRPYSGSGSTGDFTVGGNLAVTGQVTGIFKIGTSVTTDASSGEVVLANNRQLRAANSGNTGSLGLLALNTGNQTQLNLNNARLNLANANTAATVGAAGGASALPATPAGYLNVQISGVQRKIPYYTDS